MSFWLKKTASVVASLALAFSSAGCTTKTQVSFEAGSKLVLGEQALLQNLNSGVATDLAGERVSADLAYLTMPSFFSRDAQGNLVANQDFGTARVISATTVEYQLTGKAKWSDGVEVSGQDLNLSVLAANGVYDPVNQTGFNSSLRLTSLAQAHVAKVSATAITLEYKRIPADWQTNLVVTAAAHLVNPNGADPATDPSVAQNFNNATAFLKDGAAQKVEAKNLVTAGAYKISGASATQVTLVHNPDFTWGPAATIDKLTIRYFDGAQSLLAAIKAGQVDLAQPQETSDTAWSAITAVTDKSNGSQTSGIGPFNEFALMNHSAGSTFSAATYNGDETKARLLGDGFMHFIPRAGIYATLLSGSSLNKTDSFVFAYGTSDYSSAVQQNGTDKLQFQNAELAQEDWKQAGFARTLKVRVLFDSANPRAQLEYSQLAQWAKVSGFTLENVSTQNVPAVLASGLWDLYIADLPRLSLDASSISALSGSLNGLDVAAVQALVNKIVKSPDLAKQAKTLSALDHQLVSAHTGLPLFEIPSMIFTSKKLSKFKPTLNQQFATWGYPYWSVSTSSK